MNKTGPDTGPDTGADQAESPYKLGMFSGVFTPSILTILGIILFLRTGYTAGHAGLLKSLVLVTVASLVSILTTASLSAIATNIQIKGGGAYYLISRTLGVRFGGAIGLVLYAAQSVSIAFYCMGFGEAVTALIPEVPYLSAQGVAMAAAFFLFFLAWVGADLATKFQYVVMGLLILALGSFFIGGVQKWETARLLGNLSSPEQGLGFWVVFAIFFPAVTGFTQGVNMSGDLKEPGRAIPLGTFLAVGLSTLIYYLTFILFSAAMPNQELMADYDAMKKVALVPGLINAGVIAATLSSAMASFLGAPRILQSISKDRIFTFLAPFAKGEGKTQNPRRGVLLCLAITAVTIGLGQLNLVARVVSMFFLISYGLINYATFYESRTASPSFRPRFKLFSPWLSLAGAGICAAAVLAIDIKSGIMAVALLTAVYQYLKRRRIPARWADSRRSHYLQRAKENLDAAAMEPEHDRDWRPVILAFTNNSERLRYILEFSSWLEGRAGMTAAVRLVEGEGVALRARQEELYRELGGHIRQLGSKAHPLVITVPDISPALPSIIQSYGLGPVRANTLLINWMDEMAKGLSGIGPINYAKNLRICYRQGLNLVLLNADANRLERVLSRLPKEQRIDVWWNGDAASRLMLLLAYLATRRAIWAKAVIRVMVCDPGDSDRAVDSWIRELMADFRIDAVPVVVPDDTAQTIIESSSDASLVFLPCRIRENRVLDIHGGSLMRLLPHLPMSALVMAAQEIDLEAEPDKGAQRDLAAAEDEMKEAGRKLEAAQKAYQKLQKKAQVLTETLEAHPKKDAELPRLIKEADQAMEAEEAAFRRAAKAGAKAGQAAHTLEQLKKETLLGEPDGDGE